MKMHVLFLPMPCVCLPISDGEQCPGAFDYILLLGTGSLNEMCP